MMQFKLMQLKVSRSHREVTSKSFSLYAFLHIFFSNTCLINFSCQFKIVKIDYFCICKVCLSLDFKHHLCFFCSGIILILSDYIPMIGCSGIILILSDYIPMIGCSGIILILSDYIPMIGCSGIILILSDYIPMIGCSGIILILSDYIPMIGCSGIILILSDYIPMIGLSLYHF